MKNLCNEHNETKSAYIDNMSSTNEKNNRYDNFDNEEKPQMNIGNISDLDIFQKDKFNYAGSYIIRRYLKY